MTPTQLPGTVRQVDGEIGGTRQVQPEMYEVTFAGRAGAALWAEFEDCQVSVGSDTTTLRTELPDHAALAGLLLRISDLGLNVTSMHRVEPPEQVKGHAGGDWQELA